MKMTIRVTMIINLKEDGIMGFFKKIIINQGLKTVKDTTIENEMVHLNVESIEVLKG